MILDVITCLFLLQLSPLCTAFLCAIIYGIARAVKSWNNTCWISWFKQASKRKFYTVLCLLEVGTLLIWLPICYWGLTMIATSYIKEIMWILIFFEVVPMMLKYRKLKELLMNDAKESIENPIYR